MCVASRSLIVLRHPSPIACLPSLAVPSVRPFVHLPARLPNRPSCLSIRPPTRPPVHLPICAPARLLGTSVRLSIRPSACPLSCSVPSHPIASNSFPFRPARLSVRQSFSTRCHGRRRRHCRRRRSRRCHRHNCRVVGWWIGSIGWLVDWVDRLIRGWSGPNVFVIRVLASICIHFGCDF